MKRANLDLIVAHCTDYAGDPVDRAWLLPRALRLLGYDVADQPRIKPGERVFARHPGDSQFVQAPEILDDLQAIYSLTPEPFELLGSEANRTDNPPIVWAARVRNVGDFHFGKRPAATLTAALLHFNRYRRNRVAYPPVAFVRPATISFQEQS